MLHCSLLRGVQRHLCQSRSLNQDWEYVSSIQHHLKQGDYNSALQQVIIVKSMFMIVESSEPVCSGYPNIPKYALSNA